MAETVWADWHDYIIPSIPGAPVALVDVELRNAARELFKRSRMWRRRLDRQDLIAGQMEYPMIAPDGADIVRLETVWVHGRELRVVPISDIDRDPDDYEGTSVEFVTFEVPEVVMLVPRPTADASAALRFRVSLMPSETATGIPGEMAAKTREAIKIGAMARLQLMDKKPWTNLPLGSAAQMAFDEHVATLHLQAMRAEGGGRVRGKPMWF